MIRKIQLLIGTLFTVARLNAEETTNISFNLDNDGNLNPSISIPFYYGTSKQFYSSIAYSSTNSQTVEVLDSFSDSKNASISSSKDLTLNYMTYKDTLFGYDISVGVESTFFDVNTNEFGYIHDSENLFGNGKDYYISFDNSIELDIQRHALRADIVVPMGKSFLSRVFVTLSPYTTIGVKQTTIFKPLVNETGTSSSSTVQDLSYTVRYDGIIRTGSFFDIALVAYYGYQPLKYDIAQLSTTQTSYIFETTQIDTVEETSRYIAKILLNVEILGGLKPSIGYGIEKLKQTDNKLHKSTTIDKTIMTFGFEKIF